MCWIFQQCWRRTGLHLSVDPYDVYVFRVSLAEAKTHQQTRSSERTDFNQTDDKQNHIMLENMWIQTIKKVVFVKKKYAHLYKNIMLQKVSCVVLLVPLQGHFFLKSGIPLYLNDEIQRNCILLDLDLNYLHIFSNTLLFKSKF